MSLEEALAANTAEVAKFNVNFDAFVKKFGSGSAPAADAKADAPPADKKPVGRPKKDDKPAVSFDEMKAALFKVKGEKGQEAAQAIIKDTGKAAKMAEIKPENFAAVVAACEVALAPPADDLDSGSAEDDL